MARAPSPLVEQMYAYGYEIGPHRDEHDYTASVIHQGRGGRGRREILVMFNLKAKRYSRESEAMLAGGGQRDSWAAPWP